MPALTPKQPWTYETDDGERFHLRPLTRAEFCRIIDMYDGGVPSMQAHHEAVRLCLTGWDNFKGADDKPAPWDDRNRSENIERIPWSVMVELARELTSAALVGEEDRGN